MAGATSSRSGVMTWVSTIRTTMANDPGRQFLEDQIQNDGYMFLEDYLDSILAGPRHDPFIELVKTPGRKRDVPRKTRAAISAANKAKSIITMDLDDEDFNKENAAPLANSTPVNAFHKALLQSKQSQSTSDHEGNESILDASEVDKLVSKKNISEAETAVTPKLNTVDIDAEKVQEEETVDRLVTSLEDSEALGAREYNVLTASNSHKSHLTPIPNSAHPELSIIEEADEAAERSRSSLVKSRTDEALGKEEQSKASYSKFKASKPTKTPPSIDMMAVMDIDDFTQTTNFTTTFNSAETLQNSSPNTADSTGRQDLDATTSDHRAMPEVSHHNNETEAPINSGTPIKTPIEPPHQEVHADEPSRKPGHPQYPTLGPPSPLRKSVRKPREPSSAGAYATQKSNPTASRTSWLVKAREAKALEENSKKANALPSIQTSSHVPFGNKRKSGEMLGHARDEHPIPLADDPGRTQKMSKITETSPILSMLKEQDKHLFGRLRAQEDDTVAIVDHDIHGDEEDEGSDGMINKLKKTVAGFRAVKSSGKSLGGAAATALAEARAAAEAKVAERNAAEGWIVRGPAPQPSREPDKLKAPIFVPPPLDNQVPESQEAAELKKGPTNTEPAKSQNPGLMKLGEYGRVFQPPKDAASAPSVEMNKAISNKPAPSPPRARTPVFTNPNALMSKNLTTFKPPSMNQAFTKVEAQPVAPSRAPQPLSAHSTIYSTQSTYADPIFDHDMPHWVPSTQDTDFSDHDVPFNNKPKTLGLNTETLGADTSADESWHLDEKFGETWTPVVGMKDDSMTWSTAPTRSVRSGSGGRSSLEMSHPIPTKKRSIEARNEEVEDARRQITEDQSMGEADFTDEGEDMDIEEDVINTRIVAPAVETPSQQIKVAHSQMGNQATTGGFFNTATRLMSSVLGSNKKGKEPVKSIQLAAAAAKKQQEEADKKANRLKEMEARRQQVAQKKADEDRAREEKLAKEEAERWRREKEKEDVTEKRMLKQPGKKLTQMEEEQTKKRVNTETEKKAEPKTDLKKPPSKDTAASKLGKLTSTNATSSQSALPSRIVKQPSTSVAQSSASKLALPNASEQKAGLASKNNAKAKDTAQSQMQARYQAQLEDKPTITMPPPAVPSESIELPDIDSEYYDSDDENRKRALPNWAQSPALREALQSQSTVDPDDIFGAIKPLKMEELFKTRSSRFRARTSSANWAGTDELTAHEEREYARRMGYKK